jgi:hypothetical protein
MPPLAKLYREHTGADAYAGVNRIPSDVCRKGVLAEDRNRS